MFASTSRITDAHGARNGLLPVGTIANGMASSSTSAGSGNPRYPARPVWLFSSNEVEHGANYVSGVSAKDELALRQKACAFLKDLTDALHSGQNASTVTMCVAVLQMQRFFYFHSFLNVDYRDVAAACLFLAGKSEDSPRKLGTVAAALWDQKHLSNKKEATKQEIQQTCRVIELLESCILRTISFDLNVELPHQHVLVTMQALFRGHAKEKEMSRNAYWMASDLMCTTNWCLRYPSSTIAIAAIQIVCRVFKTFEGLQDNWFQKSSSAHHTLTQNQLNEMCDEFLDIYIEIEPKNHRALSFRKIDPHGSIKGQAKKYDFDGSLLLPPPPMAPILQPKKVDINTYKERLKESRPVASANEKPAVQPRQSFLPDLNNITKSMANATEEEIIVAAAMEGEVKVSMSNDSVDLSPLFLTPPLENGHTLKSNGSSTTKANHQHRQAEEAGADGVVPRRPDDEARLRKEHKDKEKHRRHAQHRPKQHTEHTTAHPRPDRASADKRHEERRKRENGSHHDRLQHSKGDKRARLEIVSVSKTVIGSINGNPPPLMSVALPPSSFDTFTYTKESTMLGVFNSWAQPPPQPPILSTFFPPPPPPPPVAVLVEQEEGEID